jgi:hypothetical protein
MALQGELRQRTAALAKLRERRRYGRRWLGKCGACRKASRGPGPGSAGVLAKGSGLCLPACRPEHCSHRNRYPSPATRRGNWLIASCGTAISDGLPVWLWSNSTPGSSN